MLPDNDALYSALVSRDPRFDGVFYVGVTSTGIYCRPICPAKTPKAANCRFFGSAEAAEKAAFRPCLRCRPELAPGRAPVDNAQRIAALIAARIEEGRLEEGVGLEEIAGQLGLSSRQIRRIVHQELGVSPIELLQTRRLLLAKQLLTETALSVIEIAFASGFSSLRRFNDAFGKRYGMPPSRLRKAAVSGTPGARRETPDATDKAPDAGRQAPGEATAGPLLEPAGTHGLGVWRLASGSFALQLTYRPPFDWDGLLGFLGPRVLKGVEWVEAGVYGRTVELGSHTGAVQVRHAPEKRALRVEISHSLAPVLPALLGRLRHLFDLSARPDVIAAQLGQDGRLAEAVGRRPGLRVPGAFDGFELAVRAILGQQVSVSAATTLAGRFAAALGAPVEGLHPGLSRLSPTPQRVAAATVEELAALGIMPARARSILALARETAAGRLALEAGAPPELTMQQLTALPGIGPWTAQYIAMRALRWPDAFPKEDSALRNALGGVTATQAEALSQPWRPWRSYATLHLWQSAVPTQPACTRLRQGP